MHEESWRTMFPDYTQYQTTLDHYSNLEPASIGTLQPRLSDAVRRFSALNLQPRILRITAPDNTLYRDYIIELIKKYQFNSNNNTNCSQTSEKEQPIIIAGENVTAEKLFGAVYPPLEQNTLAKPSVKHGLLHQANNGYLILSITALLSNPSLWPRLKSTLTDGVLEWEASNKKVLINLPPAEKLNVKLVIIGDRYLMAELDSAEPDLSTGFAMYGEFEQDLLLNDASLEDYLSYVKAIIEHHQLPQLADSDAVTALLNAGARYAEDQTRLPLCLLWHLNLLSEASLESDGKVITAANIKASLRAKEYRESYLPERAIADIHHGQVLIASDGKEIGQVNGLTVVEMPGHPTAYGEPARISCVVHFGDGDISDVERKVELGGNIHAKGMMIMQAFVATALDLDQALPYSASIVFEQSYSEVDGDSASLAELCALMSALSSQPINQQIAVTGAVDQFGRVQAVGGINEKVEGFYKVCVHRGLTGNQGVILPKTNLSNLCLNDEVIEAIKAKQFHIWAVENVDEAIPLLTDKPFRSENEEDETILSLIEERIDYFHHGDLSNEVGILNKIRICIANWFVQN
ncbi:AAA family ATPase [Photobacterium leiognathi]|uniref:endopeptidase La n=1 Tax=Photobacterium leiognathi TaxID=553611 RepID=A0A2T3MH80_PHOLE|nr:Lon protease family protein [Photobacterium leiognathi]KJF99592.1 ATP-dependent protease [Photobacterium leiognathi]PSV93727.1 Lon protease family protein [Photobacterium leiognathi]